MFGRPKGERGSYLQWREDGITPQVVWEVLSPGDRPAEMSRTFDFYNRFGVEEYYVYDPETFALSGWRRDDYGILQPIAALDSWISPRLGIRFGVTPGEPLRLYHADGEPFLTFQEITEAHEIERRERAAAERERDRERELRASELQARLLAEAERDRLAARLRALGIDPNSL